MTPQSQSHSTKQFGENTTETKKQLFNAISELKALLKDSIDALN